MPGQWSRNIDGLEKLVKFYPTLNTQEYLCVYSLPGGPSSCVPWGAWSRWKALNKIYIPSSCDVRNSNVLEKTNEKSTNKKKNSGNSLVPSAVGRGQKNYFKCWYRGTKLPDRSSSIDEKKISWSPELPINSIKSLVTFRTTVVTTIPRNKSIMIEYCQSECFISR